MADQQTELLGALGRAVDRAREDRRDATCGHEWTTQRTVGEGVVTMTVICRERGWHLLHGGVLDGAAGGSNVQATVMWEADRG